MGKNPNNDSFVVREVYQSLDPWILFNIYIYIQSESGASKSAIFWERKIRILIGAR